MIKHKWYAKPIYALVALALVLSLGIVAVPTAGTALADEPSANTPGAWLIYTDDTPDHWVGNDRKSDVYGSNVHSSIHEALGWSGRYLKTGTANYHRDYWEFYNPPPEGSIIELRGGTSDTGPDWQIGGASGQGGDACKEKMKSLVMMQPGITLRGQDYDDGTGKMVQQKIYSNNGSTTAIIHAEAADLTFENLHIESKWKGMYAIAILRYPVTHSEGLSYDYDLGGIVIGPVPVEPAPGLTVKDCTMNNLRAPFDYHCIFEDATIVDNTVNNCYYNLIKKGGYFQGDNTITGNTFNHVGEGENYPALQVLGHTGTTLIENNTFNGWAAGQYAIEVEADISAHPITIGENVFVDQVGGSGALYALCPLASGGFAIGLVSKESYIPPAPPVVAMASFEINHAKLDFKKKADDDKVRVQGTLELDLVSGDGVVISEDVTVTVGPLSDTITMELKGKEGEKWQYKRPKDDGGIIKHMTINWKNGKFDFSMDKVDLSELTDPDDVTIGIQIGNDVGEATISMTETKHWDYKAK